MKNTMYTNEYINAYMAYYAPRDNFGPITVPSGSYFMMGDNRDESYDSRFWGPLPFNKLRGKAVLVYWPLNKIKIIKHYKVNAGSPPPSPGSADTGRANHK